ncbi:MAG: sel1 repeat family protein [Parvularculaceae bacterium]|nr:sel1 repeat family protein [Parvularculaceae bacterium]
MLQDGRAPAEAREQFDRAARQGHPVASFNLAVFNRDGIAMKRNISEAIRLFRLAAETPNVRQGQAHYELARILETGDGVALIGGDVYGRSELASHYPAGAGGLAKDEAEAMRLSTLAARRGGAYAQAELKRLGRTS